MKQNLVFILLLGPVVTSAVVHLNPRPTLSTGEKLSPHQAGTVPRESSLSLRHGSRRVSFDAVARSVSREEQQEVQWTTIAIVVGVVVFVLIVAGAIAFFVMKKKSTSESTTDAEVRKNFEQVDEGEPSQAEHYERLVKAVLKTAVQRAGPKVAKAQAVKCIVESRLNALKTNGVKFLESELKSTTGSLLQEIGATEAMIFFDKETMSTSNMPAGSIIVAGLMSPVILGVTMVSHFIQLSIVILPVLFICAWAIAVDGEAVCGIPGLRAWVYTQFFLSFFLAISHLAGAIQVMIEKKKLQAKTQEAQADLAEKSKCLADDNLDLDDLKAIQEYFIVVCVLVQEALLAEEKVKAAPWAKFAALGTVLWLFVTGWGTVLAIGWTFVPGQIAFHPKAAKTAGTDFCGMWATVMAANWTTFLSVLFFFVNVIASVKYVADHLVGSSAFGDAVLSWAKKFDGGNAGFPVMETLVKAFILRGSPDRISNRLQKVKEEENELIAKRNTLQSHLDSLDGKIQVASDRADAVKEATMTAEDRELANRIEGIESFGAQAASDAHNHSQEALEDARKQAEALAQETQKELKETMDKIWEAMQKIRDSEAVQNALHQAEDLAHQATESAQSMADKTREAVENFDPEEAKKMVGQAAQDAQKAAQDAAEKLQNMDMAEAQAQARAGLEQAASTVQAKAKELQESEAVQKTLEQAKAKAQEIQESETVQKTMAQAKEAASTASAKAQEAASTASAKAQEAASTASAKAQDAAAAASAAASGESPKKEKSKKDRKSKGT